MSELFRAISFNDDVTPVFEAMAEYCATHRVTPDSMEGCSLASRLFDLAGRIYEQNRVAHCIGQSAQISVSPTVPTHPTNFHRLWDEE